MVCLLVVKAGAMPGYITVLNESKKTALEWAVCYFEIQVYQLKPEN